MLPRKECWTCDGSGCERCHHTGDFAPAKEVFSYLFTFTVDGRKFIWQQPDFALATWTPRVEATRRDDASRHEKETVRAPACPRKMTARVASSCECRAAVSAAACVVFSAFLAASRAAFSASLCSRSAPFRLRLRGLDVEGLPGRLALAIVQGDEGSAILAAEDEGLCLPAVVRLQ